DSAHAQAGQFGYGEFAVPPYEHIYRLGRHSSDDRANLLARLDARRIEAIRAGFGISLEAFKHIVKIGYANKEVFRSPDQYGVAAQTIDHFTRHANAFC